MTRKKSFLEKMGLVEKEEFDQEEVIESLQMQSQEIDEQVSQVQIPQVDIGFSEDENFLTVEEVYEKVDLSDLDKSIFKVEEFGKHLPDDLPSEVKRQSVIGILTASGLRLEELFEDAERRINALKAVSAATSEKSATDISEKEQETASLLNQIDILKQEIIDRKSAQEKQNQLIEEELSEIGKILEFISSK